MLTLRSGSIISKALRATVTMPRIGAWTADIELNTTVAPSGAVRVTAGGTTLVAHVVRARQHRGVVDVRVVGGAGGLQKLARPKHYRSPLVRHVLADLVRDAGETLSSTSTAATLNHDLSAWTTLGVPTGCALGALAEAAGAAWRVLADGTIWVGREAWPVAGDLEHRVLDEDPPNAAQTVGVAVPNLFPGTTLRDGRKLDIVVHEIAAESCTSTLWFTEA